MQLPIVFKRKIVKSGNSYEVVIPPQIFEGLGLKLHQRVRVEPQGNGSILIVPEAIQND